MKRILILAIFISIAPLSYGQLKLGLGLKVEGGMPIVAISGTSASELDEVTKTYRGFMVGYGGFAKLGYGKVISLKLEYLRSQSDLSSSMENETSKLSDYYKLEYQSIPVLLQLNLTKGFSIELGPQFNSLKSAEADLGVITEDSNSKFKPYNGANDDYMNWVAGINFHMGKVVNLGFRYTTKGDQFSNKGSEDIKHFDDGAIMISLGFNLYNSKSNVFRKHKGNNK